MCTKESMRTKRVCIYRKICLQREYINNSKIIKNNKRGVRGGIIISIRVVIICLT